MSRLGQAKYTLCNDVELIRQPYGAAIWKNSHGDFAITNHTGRLILEACSKHTTLDGIVSEVLSEVSDGIDGISIKSDIEEFLTTAERNGHITRYYSPTSTPTCLVTGYLDRLSLVRADISITWRCNLQCGYCYARTDNQSAEIDTGEWQEGFAKLAESGAKKFIITGGEPFVRNDMMQLLRTADELEISVTLLTNGTLINDNLTRELATLDGLREVKVSLDSVTTSEKHDHFRGFGTWEKGMHGLRLLQAHDITVVVNMTIHPLNYCDILSTTAICSENGWLLEASPVVIEGIAKENHMLESISLAEYQREYSQAIEAFPNTLRVNESEITPEWDPSYRCAMLFGTVGISPEGRLKPCLRSEAFFHSLHPMFDDTPSILDLDTVDIERLEFFRTIKQIRSSFVPQYAECGKCEYLHGICNGCVVSKWFLEYMGIKCPREEVIRSEARY